MNESLHKFAFDFAGVWAAQRTTDPLSALFDQGRCERVGATRYLLLFLRCLT